MKLLAIILIVVGSVFCHNEKISVRLFNAQTPDGDVESVKIDLRHLEENGQEDDKEIQVTLHFGINEKGEVHCNGNPITKYGHVTQLHVQMMYQESKNGQELGEPRSAPVIVRIFLGTRQSGNKEEVFIEQQIIAIDGHEVVQVTVHEVAWLRANHQRKEGIIRRPFRSSIISRHDPREDEHMYAQGMPRHPEHGYGYDHDHKHHRHHHRHHHHRHRSIKCWYHHLSKKSKIALFAGGSFTFLMLLTALACCVRARQNNARTLTVTAPMDNNVTVVVDEKKDAKELDDDKYKFHFDMDNTVVVDDKKELIS